MTAFDREKPLTLGQIDNVFSDIATTANQVCVLLSALIAGGSDNISDEALLVSIECMVERIGWAADMGMMRSSRSIGPCVGDAADWMMPPVFHDADRVRAGE